MFIKFAVQQDAIDYDAWVKSYVDWADEWSRALNLDTNDYVLPQDVDGNWIVRYYGPPFIYAEEFVEEPEGGQDMRATGTMIDIPSWPQD